MVLQANEVNANEHIQSLQAVPPQLAPGHAQTKHLLLNSDTSYDPNHESNTIFSSANSTENFENKVDSDTAAETIVKKSCYNECLSKEVDEQQEKIEKNHVVNSQEFEIFKVECGLSLASNVALQVWIIAFVWCSFALFTFGYLATLWNYNWFVTNSSTKCLNWTVADKPSWIIGYFTSYHSKILLIIALIFVSLTLAMVETYKKYFYFSCQNDQFHFLFGLLHFKYARIWLLCYGFIISVSEILVGDTVFDLIYKLKMPLWSDSTQTKSVSLSLFASVTLMDAFTLCLIIAMIIIQFDLLANRFAYTIYRFCGQLIIGLILICIISLIVAESVHNFFENVALAVLYIGFYDLWYIAADILNCDGMDVTSTRIYVLGFNFAAASIILLIIFMYYAISDKKLYTDGTLKFYLYLVSMVLYLVTFLVVTVSATVRYNKKTYRIVGREQCYYLSKNSLNLLCAELWINCTNRGNYIDTNNCCHRICDVQRRHCLDNMFYNCCTCWYKQEENWDAVVANNDKSHAKQSGCACNYNIVMRLLSVLLVVMSVISVFHRYFMMAFFWRCFLLVMDVNSDKSKALKQKQILEEKCNK